MKFVYLVMILIEIYYWFFIFPKLWKNNSNKEIQDIKKVCKLLKAYYRL